MRECMTKAVEKLESTGWSKDSIRGIGPSSPLLASLGGSDSYSGITNQRETTLCWSRSTGKPLCNAMVWTDTRTGGLVRAYEKKLDEEGIDIDEEDEETGRAAHLGTGRAEAAFTNVGKVVEDPEGVVGTVGKVMEGLGFAGRGKDGTSKKRRKGKEGLIDM